MEPTVIEAGIDISSPALIAQSLDQASKLSIEGNPFESLANLKPADQSNETVIAACITLAKSVTDFWRQYGSWLSELKLRMEVHNGSKGKQLLIGGAMLYWHEFLAKYFDVSRRQINRIEKAITAGTYKPLLLVEGDRVVGQAKDGHAKEGTVTLVHQSAAKVDVNFEKDLFIDAQSFLIAGDRRAAPVHAFGVAVRSENRFGDYRPVSGVLFPFTVQEVEIATGKELNSVTCQSITANEKFDADYFGPPQYKRTSLQQMLEQLYMERSDSVSLLWTYRGFRAANPAIDTRAGVEFIGYQMAKMGDLNGAIALLKENAADYPKSASAQYGLGRVYNAAGDVQNARGSFQKALKIDPSFKKASDGLNAMR